MCQNILRDFARTTLAASTAWAQVNSWDARAQGICDWGNVNHTGYWQSQLRGTQSINFANGIKAESLSREADRLRVEAVDAIEAFNELADVLRDVDVASGEDDE